MNLKPWKSVSHYHRFTLDLQKITSIIIENDKGDYFFIEEESDKLEDISKMPYYIKEDWINYNKKDLNLKIINKHIQDSEIKLDKDILKPEDIEEINFLKSIRRDLIIKGII